MAALTLRVTDASGQTDSKTISALVTPPPPPAETNTQWIQGTWLLDEVKSSTELESLRTQIVNSMNHPAIVGFSVRAGWINVDTDLNIFNTARSIADQAGKKLAIRFMAGRRTPARFLGRSYIYNGVDVIPVPYNTDGTPNTVFEAAYRTKIQELAAWCRANRVRVLHCPWYGRWWAEYDQNYVVIGAPEGYSLEAWTLAHQNLVNIALDSSGDDLAVEFSSTGHPSTTTTKVSISTVLNVAADRFGDLNQRMYAQNNGWMINTGRATQRIHSALQMWGLTIASTRNEQVRSGSTAAPMTWEIAYGPTHATKSTIDALYVENYREAFIETAFKDSMYAQAAIFDQRVAP
jgi:hypothetical protein